MCDPARLGIQKPPDSFKELVNHVKKSHKYSTIA
jgi:hypothetical protein